jgi:hypothetical protein
MTHAIGVNKNGGPLNAIAGEPHLPAAHAFSPDYSHPVGETVFERN